MTKISLLATIAVTALVAAGCGSSSSSSSSSAAAPATSSAPPATSTAAPASSTSAAAPPAAGAGTITESADPTGALKFTSDSLSAKAGKVTVNFTNKAPEDHNFTVATATGSVVGATPTFTGGTKTITLNLKPGTYTFYCSVPGHEMAGMKGTITVK
jgi:plastocyanin